MKLTYYLRGLGTGILITALLLWIYNGFNDKTELTDLQIMKRAEALGMIKEEDTLKLDSLTPKTSEEPKESPKPTNTAVPSKSTKPKSTSTPVPSLKPKNTVTPTKKPEATKKPTPSPVPEKESSNGESHKLEGSLHKIYLPQDLVSKEIAAYLELWGIVDNATDFDHYLTKNGYDRKISHGNFTIYTDSSYKEIAEILTRSN